MVFEWAKEICKETEHLHKSGTYNLPIIFGNLGHQKSRTLSFFRDNRVIVIALPYHTFHDIQPLDVTVFGAYKNFLQSELHLASRVKKWLNVFFVGACIPNAYGKSLLSTTIREGFRRTILWSDKTEGTYVSELENLFVVKGGASKKDGMMDLVFHFDRTNRSLLRGVEVEDEGRTRINTMQRAHVPSEVVFNALHACDEKAKQKTKLSIPDKQDIEAKESVADINRLEELADARVMLRKKPRQSHPHRLALRCDCASRLKYEHSKPREN